MKKLLVILLLLLYSVSSLGVVIHLQYCCGKLESFGLSSEKKMNCTGHKTHELTNPCCDEKQAVLKLSNDQEPSKVFYAHFGAHAINPHRETTYLDSSISCKLSSSVLVNQSPPTSPLLFILNCTYRI